MLADHTVAPPRVRPLRVALAGFGVVGRSVARILREREDDLGALLEVTHVFNRRASAKRVDWMPDEVVWTENVHEVLGGPIDVLVEVMGGVGDARALVSAALQQGTSVVTANKLLIAYYGRELVALAAAHGAELRFEAAVAGGIPIIDAIERGLAGDRIAGVAGILNGTCNFILSRLADGRGSFDEALTRAQELGFAEADPASDLDGTDAAAKLVILAAVGFGLEVPVGQVQRQSIGSIAAVDFDYAARLGCTIRQVSLADRRGGDGLSASVGPALVPLESPLARVAGAENLVMVRGAYGGEVALSGRGAGGEPTAVAVVSDLLALARADRRSRRADWRAAQMAPPAPQPYYVRFVVRDRPGILAAFAAVFARHDINVDAVLQEPGHAKSRLPFVMTLEPCEWRQVSAALDALDAIDVHEAAPLALPIIVSARTTPGGQPR